MKTFEKIDLTIGIPTYNRDKFIVRAVESALHQKNCNVEVIVCDNSDNDNTMQLLRKYDYLPNFKYIRNAFNLGPVANYNKCLENATGKYFMLLGDDDYLSPNYASELLNTCLGKDVIFLGKCITLDAKGNEFNKSSVDVNYSCSGEEYIKLILNLDEKVMRFTWWMLCALTSSFRDVGGFYNTQDAQHSENILLFKLAIGRQIFYNSKAIYYYSVYPQSYGNRNIYSIAIASLQFYSWWIKDFEQELLLHEFSNKEVKILRGNLTRILVRLYFQRVIKYGPEKKLSRLKLILLFPYKSWFFKIISASTFLKLIKYIKNFFK